MAAAQGLEHGQGAVVHLDAAPGHVGVVAGAVGLRQGLGGRRRAVINQRRRGVDPVGEEARLALFLRFILEQLGKGAEADGVDADEALLDALPPQPQHQVVRLRPRDGQHDRPGSGRCGDGLDRGRQRLCARPSSLMSMRQVLATVTSGGSDAVSASCSDWP